MAIDLTQLAGNNPDPELNEQAMREIPVDEEFAEYVFLLGVDMMEEGGLDVLRKAVQQSSDPILVISQFLVQLVGQLSEVLSEEANFDPRVMLARGGFVDNITDYIVEKLNLEEEAIGMIEQEVMEMIKGLAQGEKQPDPNAQVPEDPAMPQAGGALDGSAPAPQGVGLDQMGGMA